MYGLFGAAIIEPPGVESFREYVLFIQKGIRLLDVKGNLIQTAGAVFSDFISLMIVCMNVPAEVHGPLHDILQDFKVFQGIIAFQRMIASIVNSQRNLLCVGQPDNFLRIAPGVRCSDKCNCMIRRKEISLCQRRIQNVSCIF